MSPVTCHLTPVARHLPCVTCHLSLMQTATATDPPIGNSLTMSSRVQRPKNTICLKNAKKSSKTSTKKILSS